MEKILNEILDSIKLNENDVHKWWQTPINIIRKQDFLQNPNNNFENLRWYLEDYIKVLKTEVPFWEKYAHEIYHENRALCRKYELEVSEQILKILNEV